MTTDVQSRLDELAAVRESRKTGAYDNYMALVRDTADGADVDPAAAAVVLDDAGRSCEDLHLDEQTLISRRKHRAVLDDGPRCDAEMGRHQEAVDQLLAERAKFLANINAKIQGHCEARDALSHSVAGRAQARQHLAETAWPHVRQKVEALRRELREKAAGICELQEHSRGIQSSIDASRNTLQMAKERRIDVAKETVEQHKQQLAHCTQRLTEAAARLRERQAIVDEVSARLGAAELELLEP